MKKSLNNKNFKTILMYAHFNKNNKISDYVYYTLSKFKEFEIDIIFVSTSPIYKEEEKLLRFANYLSFVDNIGYDFYAWKIGIEKHKNIFQNYDYLILMNSSVIGPLFDLEDFLLSLYSLNKDLVGPTSNNQRTYHLQSYLLCFSKKIFMNPIFYDYWSNVVPTKNHQEVIDKYELKLTNFFLEKGFSVGELFNFKKDPTTYYPNELYKLKFPFIKVKLLKDNPNKIKISNLKKAAIIAKYTKRHTILKMLRNGKNIIKVSCAFLKRAKAKFIDRIIRSKL